MSKKVIYAFLGLLLFIQSSRAQESLGLYTELMVASRSIFHGWDIAGDNNAVIHPYIQYTIGKTGLALAFWASVPMNRSVPEYDEYEFFLRYNNNFLKDQIFQFSVNGFADYIICPNTTLTKTDGTEQTKMLWKYNAGIAFNNLIKIAGSPLTPAYNFFHFRPFGDIDFEPGSVHELSLYYTIPVLSKIKAGGTVNYHTGAFNMQSGWTHATTQVSTSVKLGPVNLAGSVNYQWSFNERSDIADEFWVMFGINKSF